MSCTNKPKKLTPKKIILFLIILIALLVAGNWITILIRAAISGNNEIQEVRAEADEQSKNWMSLLPDSINISEISIPGTHDSGTNYTPFHYCFQCQDTTIKEQLDNGFRLLDLRFRTATDKSSGQEKLSIVHGIGHCRISDEKDAAYLYFDDVLSDTYTFLEDHPGETILFLVDQESDREDFVATSRLLQKYIAAEPERWYTQNRIPSLAECRGKIVLMTRFGDVDQLGDNLCGIDLNWSPQGNTTVEADNYKSYPLGNEGNQFYHVQNHYQYSADAMWDAFSATLSNCPADRNNLCINYLSIATWKNFVPCPKEWARDLNTRLLETGIPKGARGIVILDFGTRELAELVYGSNF